DRHRLQSWMVDIGGNNHAAAGHFIAHQRGCELLAVGDVAHLFRDHALTGVVHLREITASVRPLALDKPFCAGLRDAAAVTAVAGISVGRGHVGTSFRLDSTGPDYTRTPRANGTPGKSSRRSHLMTELPDAADVLADGELLYPKLLRLHC